VTEFEKLLTVVSRAPANTDFSTLVKLMRSAGFELKMGKRQHAIFINRTYGKLQNVAKPHRGPVKPVYVRDCLKIIGELRTVQEESR
jgi:hypothetical protein